MACVIRGYVPLCVLQCKHVTPLRGDMGHELFRSVNTFNMRAASGMCPICVLSGCATTWGAATFGDIFSAMT